MMAWRRSRQISRLVGEPDIALEDIHMAVETKLGEHIGALAGKLPQPDPAMTKSLQTCVSGFGLDWIS